MINNELFEYILKTGESDTVEFKTKIPPVDIIVKNILAFANSPKMTSAFIIIGIEEYPNIRVVGLPPNISLNKDWLFEKLKEKVNPVPEIHVYNYEYQNKNLCIIEIPPNTIPYIHYYEGSIYVRSGAINRKVNSFDIGYTLQQGRDNIRQHQELPIISTLISLFSSHKQELERQNAQYSDAFSMLYEQNQILLNENGIIKQRLEIIDNTMSLLPKINERQNEIHHIVTITQTNIGNISNKIDILQNELLVIKSSEQNIEQRINLLSQRTINYINSQGVNLDNAEVSVKSKIPLWNKLSSESLKFIIVAEYLFDSIENHSSLDDYSSSVVQFCKTIERELKMKLFEAFKSSIDTTANNSNLLYSGSCNTSNSYFSDVKFLAPFIFEPTGHITLTQMTICLEKCKIITARLLLTNLKAFIDTNTVFDNQIFGVYLDGIKQIRDDDYRNLSAHTEPILRTEAILCRNLSYDTINEFLTNYKI